MKSFDSNGTMIHYRADLKRTGAKTFVFINSLGTDFRLWDGVVEALGGHFNLVLHDKRGHGLSGIRGPTEIATYADDVRRLIEILDLKNVVLCGISVGGLIAQKLLTHQVVVGAVLSNTGLKIGTDETWNRRINLISEKGIDAIADDVMTRWFASTFRNSKPEELALYRTMLARTDRAGYLACCKAIRDEPAFQHEVKKPTLCIGGSHDGSTPPHVVKALVEHLNSDYFEFENCGHLPCVEEPAQFAQLISDFADKLQ